MKCAYCNGPCDDRPVQHEAVCWDCHTKRIEERGKMEDWRIVADRCEKALDRISEKLWKLYAKAKGIRSADNQSADE